MDERTIEEAILKRSKAAQAAREELELNKILREGLDPLSVDAVCTIRSRLPVDTPRAADSGLRKRDVKIVEALASETRVDCPPSWQAVPQSLATLFQWMREARDQSMCPILMGAAVHHGIVMIHPFLNGNGRTARVLASVVSHRGPEGCHVNVPVTFGLRPSEYYENVRQSLYRVEVFRDWLVFLSDRVQRDGAQLLTCQGPPGCRFRFAYEELTAGYARIVEEVKGQRP